MLVLDNNEPHEKGEKLPTSVGGGFPRLLPNLDINAIWMLAGPTGGSRGRHCCQAAIGNVRRRAAVKLASLMCRGRGFLSL
jgi:hypothetical protein